MIGPAMDRGGLQHSKNAPNSIFSKINRTGFWRFGTDMLPTTGGLNVAALLCVYLFMTISIFKSGMAGAYMAVKLLLHTSLFL